MRDNFEVVSSTYEEDNNLDLTPIELVKKHFLSKTREFQIKGNFGVIIGSDCVV